MKKNLLQLEAKEEIISRIDKLTPESLRQWGKMNVHQSLRHLADGITMAYGDIVSKSKSPGWLVQKLMRFVIFNTDMGAPKGKAITFPELDMVERNIQPDDFNAEKSRLVELIKSFPAKPTYPTSTMLGPMTKENWARLNYGHIDHHLKQFGV
jgi:hypothetical protein